MKVFILLSALAVSNVFADLTTDKVIPYEALDLESIPNDYTKGNGGECSYYKVGDSQLRIFNHEDGGEIGSLKLVERERGYSIQYMDWCQDPEELTKFLISEDIDGFHVQVDCRISFVNYKKLDLYTDKEGVIVRLKFENQNFYTSGFKVFKTDCHF